MDALKAVSLAADGWAAGLAASRALGALMEGRAIACEPRGRGLLRPHFLSYAAPVAGHMIAQERLPSLARSGPMLGHTRRAPP